MFFDRVNKNFFSSWWWTIDRPTLVSILILAAYGLMLVATASPAVAEKIGLDSFHFTKKQIIFLNVSIIMLLILSFLPTITIRRLAVLGFFGGIIILIGVLIFAPEVKGSKRWIYLAGFSLQPSEFMKPFFAVFSAWMLAHAQNTDNYKGYIYSSIAFLSLLSLLILQPDIGMSLVITAIWGGQIFIAGLNIYLCIGFVLLILGGIITAYFTLSHVRFRIDRFLETADLEKNYQVKRSLESFDSGGVFGQGLGDGIVKNRLPDSHTDFIFAVLGEEMGAITCISIVMIYGFIVIRSLKLVLKEKNLFVIYATCGIIIQFGVQALINMLVTLNLIPTKGMTLPLISYGGSSMMATAISLGMLLALTRKRFGDIKKRDSFIYTYDK